MIRVNLRSIVAGLAASVAVVSAAHAGGFDRGTADTDVLYEDGVVSRSGFVYVNPMRDRDTFSGAPSSGYENEAYIIPSFATKLDLAENVACAATLTTPFGGNSNYENFTVGGTLVGFDPTSSTGTTSTEFVTREYGATCKYGMQLGKGKISFIGGLFVQDLDYEQRVGGPGGPLSFKLKDTSLGYRMGAAYEIPEIALRAQVMYRSAVDVDATGDVSIVASGASLGPAIGAATFPQSFEAKVQSGIAPGWLLFGSVKWTDWSVFDVLTYTTPLAAPNQTLQYYWRDGWTVSGGVAHVFSDAVAGSLSLTWDRGVGTGHDISTDTWTVAAGASYKPHERVEIRGGVGLSYLTSGSQNYTQTSPTTFALTPNIYTSDASWAVATSFAVKVKF
tara:strand:- start:10140 stop:11312 length:1173 start_codon:yes stop_codon:yes gene_type:complete